MRGIENLEWSMKEYSRKIELIQVENKNKKWMLAI